MHKGWTLLVAMLFMPVAAAQTQVLQDDSDDAQALAFNQVALPAGAADPAPFDLLGLWVDESVERFGFTVQVSGLSEDETDPADSGFIYVDFNHADQGYRLQITRDAAFGAPTYDARFQSFDSGRQQYVTRGRLDVDVRPSEGMMTVEVPRDAMLDGNGTAPTQGRQLSLFKAFTRGGADLFGPNGFMQVTDAMPDSGFGDTPYDVVYGLIQSGDARLLSQNPVRASNGEKGTFVFYVEGHNFGDQDDRFSLSTRTVPEGWEVTLPAPWIRIEANSSVQFPVIVSTPFAHQHGAFENFVLEMQNERDAADTGRIQLGIRYLETPQPAGHHSRLHIHSHVPQGYQFGPQTPLFEASNARAYMNTNEEDSADEGIPVPPENVGFCCNSEALRWRVYLEPGLQLGLDFDLNDTGDIQLEFDADIATSPMALHGSLVHRTGTPDENGALRNIQETVLADVLATSPKAVSGQTSFDSIIQPKIEGDLVPYDQHAALYLELWLTTDDQTSFAFTEEMLPHLVAGSLRLPLNEYRDPIEDVFNALAGLDFTHADRAEKRVNPGEVVLFNLTLQNEGAVDDYFDLRINGTNADWARILGDPQIFVPTGQTRQVVVAVAPPTDAPDQDVVDLIVTAASRAEPTTQGNIRIVALVDTILDHPDESHLVQDVEALLTSDKKSPGFESVALFAILAGLVAVLPRRR